MTDPQAGRVGAIPTMPSGEFPSKVDWEASAVRSHLARSNQTVGCRCG